MSNTFEPDLEYTLGTLLRPASKAALAIDKAHETIAARQKAATRERHPQVTGVSGRVISVDFGKR